MGNPNFGDRDLRPVVRSAFGTSTNGKWGVFYMKIEKLLVGFPLCSIVIETVICRLISLRIEAFRNLVTYAANNCAAHQNTEGGIKYGLPQTVP